MKVRLVAGVICLVAASGTAQAQDSTSVALSLGSVIAAEKACGFQYDQDAIRLYIRKNVPASDMEFSRHLNTFVGGTESELRRMSGSALTAFCEQNERTAHFYGFMH